MNSHPLRTEMSRRRWTVSLVACLSLLLLAAPANAILIVGGSPGYDSTTGDGYQAGVLRNSPGSPLNNHGVGVGVVDRRVGGALLGSPAVRFESTGAAGIVLGDLGLTANGSNFGIPFAINDAGVSVGYITKVEAGLSKGNRAVRWSATGAVMELENLGVSSAGSATGRAVAINATGTAAGRVDKYVAGSGVGNRAVKWDDAGNVTELPGLGTNSLGVTQTDALAINDAGIIVGTADKYDGTTAKGSRAVRWDAAGNITELGTLGIGASGNTSATATDISETGIAVGQSLKIDAGVSVGNRAVLWNAGSTTAVELDNLGLHTNGTTLMAANDVNDSGTSVGFARKYDAGVLLGERATRWDIDGNVTELANLGTDVNGNTNARAAALNIAGTAVGYAETHSGGVFNGRAATIWLPDGSAVNMNTLPSQAAGDNGSWYFLQAEALTADGWVAGTGVFTPDTGDEYWRYFVTQVGFGGEWTDAHTGSLDGTWGRGPQWSTGTPAMAIGDAVFSADASYTVTLDRDETSDTVAIDAGTVSINFDNHTLTAINGLSVASGATLQGSGTIIGDIENNGTINPGNSPGSFVVEGNYLQLPTGKLVIEIGGTTPGVDFDQLFVTGDMTLDGMLVFEFINGYEPQPGDMFNFLHVDGVASGAWQNIEVNGLSPELSYLVASNDDGSFAFNTIVGAPVPSSSVPEPVTAAFFLIAGAAVMMRRMRG